MIYKSYRAISPNSPKIKYYPPYIFTHYALSEKLNRIMFATKSWRLWLQRQKIITHQAIHEYCIPATLLAYILGRGGQVTNSTASMTKVVAEDGKLREMLMLPLKMINDWLFLIDSNRVNPEVKQKVIEYQEECFDVLANGLDISNRWPETSARPSCLWGFIALLRFFVMPILVLIFITSPTKPFYTLFS